MFVLLDDDELAELEPEPSRDVEVKLFVAPRGIAPQLYERPYWLGPDGDQNAYLALAQALAAKHTRDRELDHAQEALCRVAPLRW